jgi:hypothetical protein
MTEPWWYGKFSQNGWPVIPPGATPETTPSDQVRARRIVIPGTDRGFWVRDGDVAMVLGHYVLKYHERVHKINLDKQWDDWAYNLRPIVGSSDISNHASGTAIDIDALRHPQGKRNTFKQRWRVMRLRRMLRRQYRSLIRWGGDYVKTPDEMHSEIDGNPAQIHDLAMSLAKTWRGRRFLAANPGLRKVLNV